MVLVHKNIAEWTNAKRGKRHKQNKNTTVGNGETERFIIFC